MKKLAIVLTHPIQYYSPIFKLLTLRGKIHCKVFYTWGEEVLRDKFDPDFGRTVNWDIPLLDGYEFTFLKNTASHPGSHAFSGIINPYIVDEIKNYHPDAIFIFGWSFNAHLKVLRYFSKKIPIIFRGDSNLLDDSGKNVFKLFARRVFLTWVYSHVDIALYVGGANKEYYIKHGVKHGQLKFAPHAVDNSRFLKNEKIEHAAQNLKNELGIPEQATCFLFAGKLESKKNPEILLRSFIKLNSPRAYLLMVGNGKLEFELKSKYGSSANVKWLDFQNQSMMPAVYQSADIYILPSKGPGETWGLAVNEAMAAGLAIIVSDKVGCAADLVNNKGNGFVFASEDEEQLSLCMKKILESASTLEKMKKCSQEIIEDWNITSIAESLEEIVLEDNGHEK